MRASSTSLRTAIGCMPRRERSGSDRGRRCRSGRRPSDGGGGGKGVPGGRAGRAWRGGRAVAGADSATVLLPFHAEREFRIIGTPRCCLNRGVAKVLTDEGVVVLGIPIPSSSPLFLSIVAIHVVAGLVCTLAGIGAMMAPKRAGRHPAAGAVYYWSLVVVFLSMA